MAEEKKTFVVKKPSIGEIIRLRDPGALEVFLDKPLPVISQAVIELMSHGSVALAGPAVRIVQGALKGSLFKQLAREIKELQEKGKLAEDFGEREYGFQSWVELLTTIDEDTPDEKRLEAMKAMFYSANRVNATDAEEILGYQLFQIAKGLRSNELLVLKGAYDLSRKGTGPETSSFRDWAYAVSQQLGHGLTGLIEHADRALVENQLLGERFHPDRSGIQRSREWRLTDLGIRFCRNIELYRIDTGIG